MGTPEIVEITVDPWINETGKIALVLMWAGGLPQPGGLSVNAGFPAYFGVGITDANGHGFTMDEFVYGFSEGTESTAYPFAGAISWALQQNRRLVVLPGWKLSGHVYAVILLGTVEDLRGYL
ncbi:MAG: hypothetical protein QW429_04975 [Thermoprotei archaeon]